MEYPGLAQSALVTRPAGPGYLALVDGLLALLGAEVPADRAAWGGGPAAALRDLDPPTEQGTRNRAVDASDRLTWGFHVLINASGRRRGPATGGPHRPQGRMSDVHFLEDGAPVTDPLAPYAQGRPDAGRGLLLGDGQHGRQPGRFGGHRRPGRRTVDRTRCRAVPADADSGRCGTGRCGDRAPRGLSQPPTARGAGRRPAGRRADQDARAGGGDPVAGARLVHRGVRRGTAGEPGASDHVQGRRPPGGSSGPAKWPTSSSPARTGSTPSRPCSACRTWGHRVALCEGGPTLLGELVAAGRLDELCLTIAPLMGADPLAGLRVPARCAAPALRPAPRHAGRRHAVPAVRARPP